ncbi:hypothetical protein RQP46_008841 [Phenoliferia psychrophenolica]
MVKSKSSASSATRKKHAKKAEADEGGEPSSSSSQQPAQRGQKKEKGPKKSRFEPKVKSYTPPPPPPKGMPDPVDLYLGGGGSVDPELVVILRRLGKRDEATIFKAVDGFATWVNDVASGQRGGSEDWEKERARNEVVEVLSVWAHHLPRLALHESRRLRFSSVTLHDLLTSPSSPIEGSREALIAPLWIEQPSYIGAWCCSAFDGDRAVRLAARHSWDSVLDPSAPEGGLDLSEHAPSIVGFLADLIAIPDAPPATSPDDAPTTDASVLRTQSLLALAYLVGSPISVQEDTVRELLQSEDLWDHLDKDKETSAGARTAAYDVLEALVKRTDTDLLRDTPGLLESVARTVLRSCWGERDGWAGVVAFLRRYPEAWALADQPLPTAQDEDAPSDDEDDEAEADEDVEPTPSTPTHTSPLSHFQTHLSLACTGSPSLYPTIILLFLTIPPSVLPRTHDALSLFFESFWAAWGSRALSLAGGGGVDAEGLFFKALLECVWQVAQDEMGGADTSTTLVQEWVERAWKALVGQEEGERKVRRQEREAVIGSLKQTLEKLVVKDEALFNAAWIPIEASARELFALPSTTPLEPLAMALESFVTSAAQSAAMKLVGDSISLALTGVEQDATRAKSAGLLHFIEATRSLVPEGSPVLDDIDKLCVSHLPTLLHSSAAPTALAFLTGHLRSATVSAATKSAVWTAIFSSTTPLPPTVILKLIDARLPPGLPSANLDEVVFEAAERTLSDESVADPADLKMVKLLLSKPEPFISLDTAPELLALVSNRLETLILHALSLSDQTPDLDLLSAPIEILAHYIRRSEDDMESAPAAALFEVAHLLPNSRFELSEEVVERAQDSWDELASVEAQDEVTEQLRRYLLDVDIQSSPIEVINATMALLASSPRFEPLDVVLPPPASLSELYASLSLSRPSPALSIIEPLISQADDAELPATAPVTTDAAGLNSFARAVLAILDISARDLPWVKKNIWILPHVLLVADVARDELALPAATASGMFAHDVDPATLERLVHASDGLAAYLLSSAANTLENDWHPKAVAQLRSKNPLEDATDLLGVMDLLARRGRNEEDVYARRALATCIQTILKYTEANLLDAERWMGFAQTLPEGSSLACAIITAIKPILYESPRFVRYQSELASDLIGVRPAAANTRGLNLLNVLLSTAPPLDAPIIFLPQQRAMNVIRQISSWIGSDELMGDQMYSAIAELFLHLAPIVQELSGEHWDLIFDIIESNLETANWEENVSLPALYHSCRLLGVIKDLAASNPELRITSKARIDKSLELVRDLFVKRPASGVRNAPRLVVLEIMATLVRALPVKLLKMGPSFDQLVKLLRDPSLAVQLSSYDLVDRIAAKYVSDLVVEVELDTESPPVIELPKQLVKLLSKQLAPSILETPEDYSKASTFLLAWLTAFRFFEKASPRIKAAYIDQLRRLDTVAVSFLPSMFALLGLSDRGRAFDVSPWQVDDFRVELMDEISAATLPVFASFVYYRALQAVPSLIRVWWESCTNRQLHMAVSTFTSRHFSPVLIAAELAHLRDPNDPAGKSLRDNPDFTVKVAAGANEVKAVFVVDEQTMEIGVRLPNEFPLLLVEVKDVRKVGVNDKQWRAWILAVQQVIITHNGLIADALSLFKKNVTLHFDGVEPCAICYSIISVVDRSLPTKKCRTCNNLFHAGCLFKWFSTSHGSSCPMCRSLF